MYFKNETRIRDNNFLTTHYMDEALNCDNVVIINEGNIVESGTPSYLREKYTKDKLKIYTSSENIEKYFNENNIPYSSITDGYSIDIDSMNETLKILNELSNDIKSFEVIKGNMDDAFLNIIERSNKNVCND